MWTVEMLLNMVQELLGEPVGGFYNISQRLAHLSQAQNELVGETTALLENAEIPLTAEDFEYDLPANFQRFGTRQPYVDDGSTKTALKVVPPSVLDQLHPGWRAGDDDGTPQFIVQEGNTIVVYPTPTDATTLHYNYIPLPAELTDFDQLPFDERPDLNKYAPALAYKVAFLAVLPRSPQLGQVYEDMYIREEKKMRHYVRSNAQLPQSIYPTVRWTDAARD